MFVNTRKGHSLGSRIRDAREASGLSQQALAVRVGVSLRTVQWWERDDREPQLASVRKIALATGQSVSHFVDDSEEKAA